ncbi:MgtC/SapB family protein [Hamadaea tsunoensis]|uniref:MgtC/SapB family protein n=1 Tax=Hamadaea tsunoensis TaxID=53368 RepID=UPI00042339E2|nr:MgtC/SapB family protein [Hamadaea tsunoensis]
MLSHAHVLIGLHVLLAFVLSFVLGFERQLRGSVAGDRTFALIGTGAAVIGVLSANGAPTILTGAITGVGFIGAGVLFRQGEIAYPVVHGVTTAAAILACAAIGAAAGQGDTLIAIVATALVLLTLELRYVPFLRVLDAARWAHHFANDDDPVHPVPAAEVKEALKTVPGQATVRR